MAEALQKISAEELARISQTLDESGKIDTIKHELDEAAGHFAQDLYIVGNNENITSRGVERYVLIHFRFNRKLRNFLEINNFKILFIAEIPSF